MCEVIVELHPHARERLDERGVTEEEIIETVRSAPRQPAKFGRSAFRKAFAYNAVWRGRRYAFKEVEAIAVDVPGGMLVLTVIARFY
jgi:hypothetical protein